MRISYYWTGTQPDNHFRVGRCEINRAMLRRAVECPLEKGEVSEVYVTIELEVERLAA